VQPTNVLKNCYFISLFLCLSLFASSGARAQLTKDSVGYTVFDPRGLDSVPASPTLQSIFREPVATSIRRISWYRIGPKAGFLLPSDPKVSRQINSIGFFLSADLLYSRPESGFGPTLSFYSISRLSSDGNTRQGYTENKHNRFYLIAPAYSYQHFFYLQPDFIPYVEIDAAYMVGQLRVNSAHINTGLKSSFGTSLDAGAVVGGRFKLYFSYLLMRQIDSYSLNGFTASVSYFFAPLHKW